MRIHLCGVRGSTPAPGEEFARYGGQTSCVALAHDAATGPALILDAGTGLRRVTALLGGRSFSGTILLTHLHWDHVHGLPFFAADDRDGSCASLLLPAQPDSAPAVDVLARGNVSAALPDHAVRPARGLVVRDHRARAVQGGRFHRRGTGDPPQGVAAPSVTGSATVTPPSPTSPTIARLNRTWPRAGRLG